MRSMYGVRLGLRLTICQESAAVMLLGGEGSEIKEVAVATRNQQFWQLLSSILAEWKVFSVTDLAEARVVFAERGIDLPDLAAEVVWLTPQPLPQGR